MRDIKVISEEIANREYRRFQRAKKKGRGASKKHMSKAKRSRRWAEAVS